MTLSGLSVYQLLVPLFSVLMIAKAVSRFKRRSITVRELIVWVLVWGGLSFTALFPDFVMHWLSVVTGIKSGFNAIIFFLLVIIIYWMLNLQITKEEHERELTEIVRKLALRDFQEDKPDRTA